MWKRDNIHCINNDTTPNGLCILCGGNDNITDDIEDHWRKVSIGRPGEMSQRDVQTKV